MWFRFEIAIARFGKGDGMKLKQGVYTVAFAAAALVASIPAFAAPGVSVSQYVSASKDAGTLTPNGSVRFSGTRIEIPVIAVEPGKPDTTFEVHGKVNPTLIVPAGAKLRFVLANADTGMPHGLDVTLSAPPYGVLPHLPMMAGTMMNSKSMRRSMMGGAVMMKKSAAATGTVNPKADGRKSLAVKKTGWFTLKPGTYYYVCPIPGHAKQGMYGKIIVR